MLDDRTIGMVRIVLMIELTRFRPTTYRLICAGRPCLQGGENDGSRVRPQLSVY